MILVALFNFIMTASSLGYICFLYFTAKAKSTSNLGDVAALYHALLNCVNGIWFCLMPFVFVQSKRQIWALYWSPCCLQKTEDISVSTSSKVNVIDIRSVTGRQLGHQETQSSHFKTLASSWDAQYARKNNKVVNRHTVNLLF
uniref:G_PROTEIN_RECEP_F2_4 domain-containing protein n=1 Tax=Panagrellus redivivus TaxID=6233 RepID=A0A7E4ZSP7_PANRE